MEQDRSWLQVTTGETAQGQATQIIETGLQPSDDREAAILAYLNPGQYTAVERGKNNSTGNALVEVYDLGTVLLAETSNSRLANIATRGTVLGGDNVMIGGFIIVSPNHKSRCARDWTIAYAVWNKRSAARSDLGAQECERRDSDQQQRLAAGTTGRNSEGGPRPD